MNWWGHNATSGLISITTSGTSLMPYANTVYYPPPQLPGVLESPTDDLSDREWLDAQIAEVCELAVAA